MEIVKIICDYMKQENAFTFGTLNDEAFIDKLPTTKNGIGIIVSETTNHRQPIGFGNKPLSFQERSVSFYITGIPNDTKQPREKSYIIYETIRKKTTIGERIFSIVPYSPQFVSENEKKQSTYVVEMEFKTRD